ncbi:MAG: VOC family protein [bacterium]
MSLAKAVDHTAITVADMDEAVNFYHNVLGMPIVEEFYDEYEEARIVYLKSGDNQIELLAFEDPEGAASRGATTNLGLSHLAFMVDDVRGAYEELVAKGVEFTLEPRDYPGGTYAYFRGPGGAILELIQRGGA